MVKRNQKSESQETARIKTEQESDWKWQCKLSLESVFADNCLQCFDTVARAYEEHLASKKLSDEVLV